MRRFLVLIALCLAAMYGCAPKDQVATSALERIRERGELVIGTDATYPPFESKVGSELIGFDVDLGRAIATELGVKVRWVNASFDGIFPALLANKFDLVLSAVTITPERQKTLAFSDPYYNAGQIIAIRKNTPDLRPEDLGGKVVGVQINTTAQVVLEKRPEVRIKKYNSIDLAFLDLQNGRIDAVVNDAPTTRYMLLKSFPALKVCGVPFTQEHYGIVVHPANAELVAEVNRTLATIRERGDYDRIFAEWFGKDPAPPDLSTSGMLFNPALLGELWRYLLAGMVWTVQLTLWGLVWGLPIGLVVGLMRVSPIGALRRASGIYVEAIRGTPLLVQIFTIYFVLPALGIKLPEYVAAVIALSFNASAYIAEIFRAGIQSIPSGQMEAARSLGFGYLGAMQLVILPQAFRRVVPPLTNEAIALLKDSSLVSIMGMTELTRTGQELASRLASPTTVWIAIAVCYLALTMPLTGLARWLERHWTYEARA